MKKSSDMIKKQAESMAKNQLRAQAAGLRRETSIVGQAHKLAKDLPMRTQEKEAGAVPPRVRRDGIYTNDEAGLREAYVAADGYVRRSPVQQLRVAPGYRRRLVRRAILGVLAAVACGLVIYMILGYIF